MKKQHLLHSDDTEMDLDSQFGLDDDDSDDLYLHPYPDTEGFSLFF